jgi:hypothetical protein
MNNKTNWIITIIVAIIILIIFLLSFIPQRAQDDTIKIGVVTSLTGGTSSWGKSIKTGIDLASKEIILVE